VGVGCLFRLAGAVSAFFYHPLCAENGKLSARYWRSVSLPVILLPKVVMAGRDARYERELILEQKQVPFDSAEVRFAQDQQLTFRRATYWARD